MQRTDGTQGTNDWYTSDVTIQLAATDNLSGVSATYSRVDQTNTCDPVAGGAFGEGQAEEYQPDTSTVALWHLNESSGTIAADSSGNGYDLNLIGGGTWVNGRFNNAVDLEYDNVQYLERASLSSLIPNDFTYNFWVKLETDNVLNMLGVDGWEAGGHTWTNQFYIRGDIDNSVMWYFYNGVDLGYAKTTEVLTAGNWYMITFVRDTGKLKIYINGIESVYEHQDTLTGTSNVNDDTFVIGAYFYSSPLYPFDGIIDEVAIWNRSLSADEVKNLAGITAGTIQTITSEGTNYVRYYSVDNAGNAEEMHTDIIKIDKTPPTTEFQGPDGWINVEDAIVLRASDAMSGVAATYVCVDLTGTCMPTESITTATLQEGINHLRFYSVDVAGNAEGISVATFIGVDKTPPVTALELLGTLGNNGWYTSDVTAVLNAYDALAGVKATFVCVDQENWCEPIQSQ